MKKSKFIERRAIISRDKAEVILQPYLVGLCEDFEGAWTWVQAILDQDPERRIVLDSSIQAAMIYRKFVTSCQRRLSTDPHVTMKESGRLLRVRIRGELSLRFKKFDSNLHSHNVQTNAQSAIYCQLDIDGLERATEITFGYRTDVSNRTCTGLYITCPVGWNHNRWVLAVKEGGEGTDMLPFITVKPDGGGPHRPDDSGIVIEPKEKRKTT